jgi:hypothetical protein
MSLKWDLVAVLQAWVPLSLGKRFCVVAVVKEALGMFLWHILIRKALPVGTDLQWTHYCPKLTETVELHLILC